MEIDEQKLRKWEKRQMRGKVAGGIMIAAIGVLFLGRELGAEMPSWLFSWKTLLICFGIVGMVKHGFSRLGWIIPILIGAVFLVGDIYPDTALKPVLWPSLLILIGLVIAFKPRRKFKEHEFYAKCGEHQSKYNYKFQRSAQNSGEDFIDSTSVMGGVQKNILSKQFKGGDITNVFGGTELNLMQADFEGKVTLEVTQFFGGTKLIVPSHWQIQSKIVTVIGGVEDKRPVNPNSGSDPNKILMLEGTTFVGGLEIRTF